jgi:hypothetical protein
MGELYELKGEIYFAEENLKKWLDSKVPGVFPWTEKETAVEELINEVISGCGLFEFNGHTIDPLPVEIEAKRVIWTWPYRLVPPEIGPEICKVAKIFWRSAVPFAENGVAGYRDPCGEPYLWNFAEIVHEGHAIDITQAIGFLSQCFSQDETENISDDIPF